MPDFLPFCYSTLSWWNCFLNAIKTCLAEYFESLLTLLTLSSGTFLVIIITWCDSPGSNQLTAVGTLSIIPHATSCGGYWPVRQAVSLAVSQSVLFFLVSATPLKPLNRIWWNFEVIKDIMWRYAFYGKCWFDPFKGQFISPFLSDCPSLMLGIAIHCIQHSQAMMDRGVCELAHSFVH